MPPVWWSIALTVIGVTGLYLVTRKMWVGFVIGLGVQVLWIVYAVSTSQWGFIGSALAYGFVNWLGLRHWLRDKQEAEDRRAEAERRGAHSATGYLQRIDGDTPYPPS